MSEPMSSLEIEDVLASIRRLVSDDLRPANRPHASKLILTPALRVVGQMPDDGQTVSAQMPSDSWVPDQSTLDAVADADGDHLDFGGQGAAMDHRPQIQPRMDAMQSAAEAFHSHADEFILSVSDTGSMVLHGDGGPVLEDTGSPEVPADHSAGHGAVFAVLTGAVPQADVRLPEAAELADAEGGAPIEDDADWSVVAWEDAAPVTNEAQGDAPAGAAAPEPLILSFVSARRAEVMDRQAEHVTEVDGPMPGDSVSDVDTAAVAAAVEDTAVSDLMPMAQETDTSLPVDLPIDAGKVERAPEAPVQIGEAPGDGSALVLLTKDEVPASLADTPSLAEVTEVESGPVAVSGPETPEVLASMWDAAMELELQAPAPELAISSEAHPVETAEIVSLIAAAVVVTPVANETKTLPVWTQSAAEAVARDQVADNAPDDPPATFVASSRRRAKAAAKDPGWADRAEAEIHRQLAAELGPVALQDAQSGSMGLSISEPALRDLVRDLIHEELAGKLGERITHNIRKLVQMELQRTTAVQVHEFRTSRVDAGSNDG